MAGNIKGITIELNGDTTKLDRALRNVTVKEGSEKELASNPSNISAHINANNVQSFSITDSEDK